MVRGFNGAATLQLRKPAALQAPDAAHYLLQWGRNFAVAETARNSAYTDMTIPGFNGAATLQLRKRVRDSLALERFEGFNGAATLQLRKRNV